MSPHYRRGLWFVLICSLLGAALLATRPCHAAGDGPQGWPWPEAPIPTAAEVQALLEREPITLETWPVWRRRLRDWIGDRTENTNAAYYAAWEFLKKQANAAGELPQSFAGDELAWYFLGSAYLDDAFKDKNAREQSVKRADAALRRSIQLAPLFGRAHLRLAVLLILESEAERTGPTLPPAARERLARAGKELELARQLDPGIHWLKAADARLALAQDRHAEAERLFLEALKDDPKQVGLAQGAGWAILAPRHRTSPRAPQIQHLVEQFPEDGVLACQHAVALAVDGKARAAGRELARARALGTEPTTVLPREVIEKIESDAAPSLLEQAGWVALGFAGFYAAVMALMALAGVILAQRTRGIGALHLLGVSSDELVTEGQVARVGQESALAKLYALALMAGLALFYAAIPFVLAGLLGLTGLLLFLIFKIGHIPVKLVILIIIVGLGATWAVLKSIFARPESGGFGLPKAAEQCPQLHAILYDVARRLDTAPVNEVYLAPGSAIGVHQEGRGPFGIFGVKRRVLTLGLSTMHFLTVSELQAIVAHEYAHFSHRDTFYSRFIYQVTLSIEQALSGMGQTGGKLNYLNPFFWFLLLYYKAYTLLAAGFSRSREFLADRMAASLYGADVFASALAKVATDGTLFEMTIYDNIAMLLDQDKAFINMYSAFRNFRDEQLRAEDREELYQKLLREEGSLFASHPTFRERVEAVMALPKAQTTNDTPAVELFENREEIDKELTDFLTSYVYHVRRLQAQAAAAQ